MMVYGINNRFLLSTIILLIAICACEDQREPNISKTGGEIEVKFNVSKKDTKFPEYELTFLSEDKVVARRVYKNGKIIISDGIIPDGQVVEKYENGETKNVFHYKDGKREGKATGYYENGKIKLEAMYKDDNPEGIVKTFYESGQLKTESKIIDRKKVFYKEYYKSGQLKEEIYYKNGEGISKKFDIDGKPIED